MGRRAVGHGSIRSRCSRFLWSRRSTTSPMLWMRFFGFDLGGTMPDENTIRHYRNRLIESGTLDALMQAFEQQLRERGYAYADSAGQFDFHQIFAAERMGHFFARERAEIDKFLLGISVRISSPRFLRLTVWFATALSVQRAGPGPVDPVKQVVGVHVVTSCHHRHRIA